MVMLDYQPSKFNIVGSVCWLGHYSHYISCTTLNHIFSSKLHCFRISTISMITNFIFYVRNIMNTMVVVTTFTSLK
jgi:hypothetical protein